MAFSDRCQVLRAAVDRHRSSNIDPFEKPCREVSRHPHAPVGCGIPGKITGMYADCLAEFHVVWHWRGSIMETRWLQFGVARDATNLYDECIPDRPAPPILFRIC